MIVRDSARTLPACLASIAPWVDEMIIVDTGSSDNSRQIVREHGGKMFEFPWCDDFSAARNESLAYATGNWLFWMDSDDTISEENGRALRELAHQPSDNGPTAYVMQVHCPGPPGAVDVTVVDQVKMFRNDPRLRFEGRIHEQILPAVRRIDGEIAWTDIFVVHSGAEHTPEARRRKQERDLKLLEIELAERPDHPFVLFNLGMTYADMEDAETAADYLRRCLKASSPEESHVRKAYALLAGVLLDLRRDTEAEQVLDQGLQLYENDVELMFRQGVLAQRNKTYEKAIEAYEYALAERCERKFSSRDAGITGYKARHNLAGIYSDIHRPDLAEFEWRMALAEQPRFLSAWVGLVDVLIAQRRFVTLAVEIENLQGRGWIPDAEITVAQAKLAAAMDSRRSAVELIEKSCCSVGDHPSLLRLKCELLFDDGNPEAAISALERLCNICPEDGANWHNLGTVHHQAGRLALAAMNYQKSLAVRPKSVATLVQLGYAQHSLQRPQAAERAWKEAQRLAPDDPLVVAACKAFDKPFLNEAQPEGVWSNCV